MGSATSRLDMGNRIPVLARAGKHLMDEPSGID
jgi:hypothetical protein